MTDIMNLTTYNEMRQAFFHEITAILNAAIKSSGYTTDKSLSELLEKLDDETLLIYAWKDAFSRECVFDAMDQREALPRTYRMAQTMVQDENLKKLYIAKHDDDVRQRFERESNDYSDIIKEETI